MEMKKKCGVLNFLWLKTSQLSFKVLIAFLFNFWVRMMGKEVDYCWLLNSLTWVLSWVLDMLIYFECTKTIQYNTAVLAGYWPFLTALSYLRILFSWTIHYIQIGKEELFVINLGLSKRQNAPSGNHKAGIHPLSMLLLSCIKLHRVTFSHECR